MSTVKWIASFILFFSNFAHSEICGDFIQTVKPFEACEEGNSPELMAKRKAAMNTEETLAYEKAEVDYMAAEGAYNAMSATQGSPSSTVTAGADIAQKAINSHRDAYTILAKVCGRLADDCRAACPMNAACETLNKSAKRFEEEAAKMTAAGWKAGTTSSRSKAKPKDR